MDKLPKSPEVFILGDFNCDMSKKNNLSSLIKDLCKAKALNQFVNSPTRITQTSSTTIDLILSNSKHAKECEVVDIGLSDHCLILIRRSTSKIKLPQKIINTRSFKNFDEQAFLEDLGNTDWHNVTNASNVDDATMTFNANITSV